MHAALWGTSTTGGWGHSIGHAGRERTQHPSRWWPWESKQKGARGSTSLGPSPPRTLPGGRASCSSAVRGMRGRALCSTGTNTAGSTQNPRASNIHCPPRSPRHPQQLAEALSLGLTQALSSTRTETQSTWLLASPPLRSHGNWMINFSVTLMEYYFLLP